MAFIHSDVFDNGLTILDSATTVLWICSQEPTTRTEAVSTYALGSKSSLSIGAPEARSPNGRKVVVASFTDGAVSTSGTATHWAIVDGTRLLVTGSLSASQAVTSPNPFTLTAIDIGIPAAA